jgi:hypothetical protein
MKRLFILLMVCVMVIGLFSGCASYENTKKNGGGFFVKTNGDYVIVNSSGGVIQDVWKLKNVLVESASSSDGWIFSDNEGNSISIGGDVKVIRVYDSSTWDKYNEYHYEFENNLYQEKFNQQ